MLSKVCSRVFGKHSKSGGKIVLKSEAKSERFLSKEQQAKINQLIEDSNIITDCLIKGRPVDYQTFRKAFGSGIPFVPSGYFGKILHKSYASQDHL
jgi:hypothetical protein